MLFILCKHREVHYCCNVSICLPFADSAALMAGQNLCSLPHRGDTYQSMEWVLLDVHATLLEMLMEKDAGNTPWIAQRCHRLSSLIASTTIPQSQQVLKLQEQVSVLSFLPLSIIGSTAMA